MSRRAPLLALDIGTTLRLDLRAAVTRSPAPPAFDVRELERSEMARVLGASRALARPAEQVDVVAPAGWRCFAAFDGATPVHVSFVELRPARPLLFGAISEPGARGRGAFRATIRYIAARLQERVTPAWIPPSRGATAPPCGRTPLPDSRSCGAGSTCACWASASAARRAGCCAGASSAGALRHRRRRCDRPGIHATGARGSSCGGACR